MMPSAAPAFSSAATAQLAGLDIARRIAPPRRVIHVGAGQGQGAMHYWRDWDIAEAWLIDADSGRLPSACLRTGWRQLQAVVADTDGEADFYHYSNPAEDGLLSAESLTALWSRLRATGQRRVMTQRLDTLLAASVDEADRGLSGDDGTWLLIDCLPSLAILRGAEETLKHTQVLCVRVWLDDAHLGFEEAGFAAIEAHLAGRGYRCIQVSESNHPALGEALFLRDDVERIRRSSQGRIDQLMQAQEAQTKLAEERQAQIEALTQEKAQLTQVRDAQAQLAQERQAQIETLNKERAELQPRVEHLDKQKTELAAALEQTRKAGADREAALIAEHDQALKAGVDREAKLTAERDQAQKVGAELKDTLTAAEHRSQELAQEIAKLQQRFQEEQAELAQARDAQTKLAEERQTQIEGLNKERAELHSRVEQLDTKKAELASALEQTRKAGADREAALTVERDQAQKAGADLKDALTAAEHRNQQLEQEIAGLQQRQQLFQEEMIKAEAQIELIKDLLLRDQGNAI